jgi:signal transduction histidine kinase
VTDASDSGRRSDRTGTPPSIPILRRLWWTPLAFASLALVLLAVTPIAVERRVTQIRNALTNGSEAARILVNDFEAAFASQSLASEPADATDTLAIATQGHLVADELDLRATLRRVGPEAARQFEDLNALLQAWEQTNRAGAPNAVKMQRARAVLSSAERLDNYLATVSDSLRESARRYERLDFFSAIVLAPMALLAMLIVLWAGNQLLRFARAVDQERAEVVRSTEARGELLRGVTHDIKNPLGAAAGFAQLLEEGVAGPMTQPQLEMVRRVRRLVTSSVEIVADLLEVARDDGTELQLDLAETDIGTLAQEVVADHAGMARERGVTVDVDATATFVTTDAVRLRRILSNLVSNAIKYTSRNSRVVVRVVRSARDGEAGAIGVEVADNGPGIPAELRERVFDEFFRINGGNGGANGNGLGLAISRRLARMLGGDIALRENPGGGCVFTVWLADARPFERDAVGDGRRRSDRAPHHPGA